MPLTRGSLVVFGSLGVVAGNAVAVFVKYAQEKLSAWIVLSRGSAQDQCTVMETDEVVWPKALAA